MRSLSECPTFRQVSRALKRSIRSRTIIAYNAAFDMRLYRQTWQINGGFLPKGRWECAMLQYARFVGEWNEYRGDYKWQKLEGGAHSALSDCLATLSVIKSMASAVKLRRCYQFWIGR